MGFTGQISDVRSSNTRFDIYHTAGSWQLPTQ